MGKQISQKKILFIIGTRPELIKTIPVYLSFKNYDKYNVALCNTGQHKEMVSDLLKFYKIKPEFNLNVMEEGQTLEGLTIKLFKKLSNVYDIYKPELVFVQGDTTTALVGAMQAFYKKVPVAHIESGLRTYDIYSPFPEEINRQLISRIASLNFAPTIKAKENLIREGIHSSRIYVVGNTVIDALFLTLNIVEKLDINLVYHKIKYRPKNKQYILITTHRRENFGENLKNICLAIKSLADKFKDIDFVFPVHPNPNVRKIVYKYLMGIDNIFIIEPVIYPYFIFLMANCYFIMTDSGGIQEEAPSLKKPVLVLRDKTERIEAEEKGLVKVVGTNPENIIEEASKLILNLDEYKKFIGASNPYGDGKASKRILQIIEDYL